MVAHDVLADVAKGELGSARDAGFDERLDSAWVDAVAAQWAAARRQPVEAAFGPPDAWPGFNDIRSRLLISSRRLSLEASGWSSRTVLVEEHIQLDGQPVWGTPDLVVGASSGEPGFVADHKSGRVTEADVGPGGDTRAQLLIYARLASLTGIEVGVGQVRPLGRSPIQIEVHWAEVEEVVGEADALRRAFNEKIAIGDAMSLAKPATASCGWCPYAAECPALWVDAPAGTFGPGFQIVSGTVTSVEDNGRGGAALGLEADGGSVPPGRTTVARLSTRRIPAIASLQPGAYVRLAGVAGEEGSNLVRADRGGWPRLSSAGLRPPPTSPDSVT